MMSRRSSVAARARAGAFVLLILLTAAAEFHHVYFDRNNLPNLGPFTRFEFPTIGRVYDAGGRPLIELAREYREIARYEDIPPIVRDAILAADARRWRTLPGETDWLLKNGTPWFIPR